jgi:hypothetical protein
LSSIEAAAMQQALEFFLAGDRGFVQQLENRFVA